MILRELEIKSKHKISLVIETEEEYLPLDVVSVKDKYMEYYINGIKKELTVEQKQEIDSYIQNNINQDELQYVIANEDYDKIFSKLSVSDILKGWKYDTEMINYIIDDCMDVFVSYEEYEKCSVLKNIKKEINYAIK